MDNMKVQSGQKYNWRHNMAENEVTEAVKEYKAKRKAEFEDKMFAELIKKAHVKLPEGIMNACAHDWECHTSRQRVAEAEINRFENRVTRVFCTRCLEVKDI